MEIIFSDKADQDLVRISSYLIDRSPRTAEHFAHDIDRKLNNLSAFPFIGRERPNLGQGIGGLVAGNYLIFYRCSQITLRS